MTTFATTDELDILKAQMQVLRSHLQQNEIISQEMLDATVKAEVKSIMGKRRSFLITMIVDTLMCAYFVWIYFSRPGFMSPLFLVATICWCMLWVFVAWRQYCQNMRERLLNDTLTEAALDLVKVKQQNLRHAYLTIIASIAWVCVLFWETWDEISQNPEQCLMVCFILCFVLYCVSSRMMKIHRTTTSLIRQIEEIKQSKE